MSIVLALGRLRQYECCDWGASLVYIKSSKRARATEEDNVKRDRERRGGRWYSPLIPAFGRQM